MGAATWLISELDPKTNIAFGLAYLGGGSPELGLIPIDELAAIRHPSGLRIERDIHFEAHGRLLSQYAREARELGNIAASSLSLHHQKLKSTLTFTGVY